MNHDFDYYPPRPIERREPLPSVGELEPLVPVCPGVWLAVDDPEPWLLTGDYVNIEDFWLAASPPKPHQIYPISSKEGEHRVSSKTYLSNATYAFHQMCYELAREAGGESWDYLFYEAFNIYERHVDRDQILLESQKAKELFDLLKSGMRPYVALKLRSLNLIERVLYDNENEEVPTEALTTTA